MGRHYVSQDAFTVNDGSTRGLRRTFERLGLLGVWLIVFAGFSLLNRVCPGFRQLGCRGESGVSDGVERYDGAVGEEARADQGLGARSGFAPVGPGVLSLWPMTCWLAPSI